MKCNWTKALMLLHLLGAGQLYAQATFNTIEYLDINRFNIGHLVHGDMWYKSPGGGAALEYPKGSGKQLNGVAGIWTMATDGVNDYGAAQLYKSGSSSDFWPGPLDAADICTYETSEKWARIWKVNQTDINIFRSLSSKTTATVPAPVLEWPAKGNPYAKGNAGAALSITEDMAPFEDTDGDGVYDPIKGDYPKIKGDQMLWWIINDNGATTHSTSKSTPMKIEYRISAYAYSRGGVLDNIVYYEFDLFNKSSVNYSDLRSGLFADFKMGYIYDDYLAFDSVTRMGIGYDGVPASNAHLIGLSLVEVPGDKYPGGMQPAGAFVSVEGTLTGPKRTPRTYTEFNYYMQGKTADGGALGRYPYKIGGPYEYALQDGVTMCAASEPLGNRKYELNTGSFELLAGQAKKVAWALMATDTTGNACGSSLDFKALTDVADTAWKVYYNPLPALSTKEVAVLDAKLRIYPNPTQSVVMIDSYTGRSLKAAQLKVNDATGRQLQLPVQQSSKQLSIDVSSLATGVYSLVYSDGEVRATQQFVKQ